MLLFGGGCATRALIEQTGVHVDVPVWFTRIQATDTLLIVEFDAYTDLSPSGSPYWQKGPVAPRWAAIPIVEIFALDVHQDKISYGAPPVPADLAAAAIPIVRREGDIFVPEVKEPRFEVTIRAMPTRDLPTRDFGLSINRPGDSKQGQFSTDLLIRRRRAAWAYPVVAVAMPFALVWDGVVVLPLMAGFFLLMFLGGGMH